MSKSIEKSLIRSIEKDMIKSSVKHDVSKVGLYAIEPHISFRGFLQDLKKFAGVTTKAAEEASSLLKNVDSGIKSLDDAIKSAPVTKTKDGVILIGDETVGRVNKVLREADLDEIVRIAGRTDIPITSADRSAFKDTVGPTPEKSLRDVNDLASVNKKNFPEMDATVDNLDKVSNTGKKNLKKVELNLFKYFKQGTYIALTIGAIYVTVDWIAKATNARRGCFMLTTINGETSSCKVQQYTCSDYKDGVHCESISREYYNVTLVLMHIAKLDNTDTRKINLAKEVNIPVEQLDAQLDKVIDQSYEKAAAFISSMKERPTVNVCGITHPNVEGGIVPDCRMCSPTDNPLSTTFIDPSMYGDNITFECVINPSVLDTVTDAIAKTGKNLLDGVGGFLTGPLKTIGIVIAVILVLALIIMLVVKSMQKKSSQPIDASSSQPLPSGSYNNVSSTIPYNAANNVASSAYAGYAL